MHCTLIRVYYFESCVNRHHPGIVTTGAGVGAAGVVTTVDLFADETGSESRSVHAAKNLRMSFAVFNGIET